ncbi:helix-turn-helix domain-containing protein, partial [Streptomyces meridianus]
RALRRALARRVPLVGPAAGGAGILALVDPEEGRDHARAALAQLDGHPALLETLRMWLSLHGSWDRTAAALEIHRNTVRQRIARTASLLERDLDDPGVRMELWFALEWR